MKTKKITMGALCLALSLLLPQIFHMIGMQQAGSIFLPMHLPVFIGGLLLGPIYGLFLGIFAPILSFIMIGMPGSQRVFYMMSELAAYGFFSGLLFHFIKFQNKTVGLYVSLIGAMIAGRLVYGCVLSIATYLFNIPVGGFQAMLFSITTGIPGIIIQLLLIPIVVRLVEKSGYLNEYIYAD